MEHMAVHAAFGGYLSCQCFLRRRRKSFNGKIILAALGFPLVLGFTFWIIVAWRLPALNADDINALFLIEACCVLTGGLAAKLYEVYGV